MIRATENIILASVYAEGTTKITNAAMEPEIVDLANCLNKMGAKIQGAGTNLIQITGVKKLKDISYTIMPDRIEAGTLLCMVAATNGKVKLSKVEPSHISPIFNKLRVHAQFFVNSAGTLTEMMMMENRFEGKWTSYREGPAGAPTLEIELEYATNGRLKSQKIQPRHHPRPKE